MPGIGGLEAIRRLVAFERGDLRFPYVVGSLWNARGKSPVNNADGRNDVRTIRTRKGPVLIG